MTNWKATWAIKTCDYCNLTRYFQVFILHEDGKTICEQCAREMNDQIKIYRKASAEARKRRHGI